ncbi:hypothetical protein ACFSR7_12455 [Cohnella sp. GCM10020058]|uniref:hypothetical protein n=1 Tax=Cohnella sp. GCM10020058 TaxID=3317330 RepID=UPI00363CEEF1
MSSTLSNEFQSNAPARTAQTEALVSRQAQEVQAAMVMAKRFPRDEYAAHARIMQACKRKTLAEHAEYEFPRGGTNVNGPSIRLAEVVAQSWGNIDYGLMEIENKAGKSEVQAYAWDLETNTRRSITFSVPHVRSTKKGMQTLTDPRDVYELIANNGSRRMRACILGVIPGDVIDAAVDECRKTIAGGNKDPIKDRIKAMIVAFESEYQVTQAMLEKLIGCKADAFTENSLIRLRNIGKSLRDGMAKREEFFDFGTAAPKDAGKSKAEDEFDEILRGLDGDGDEPGDAGPDGPDVPLE